MAKKIRTIELFAGVGGFRLGLEGWEGKSATSGYKEKISSDFEVVWSNQWEPSTKTQHASLVYENRFGKDGHTNLDIATIEVAEIPEHDLLVGGFPCQDYSVATTLKNSKGLIGKKGVLWWSIHKIISHKHTKYLFLENVDRLLISPSGQRGRDFAIILQSLNELGYAVEWRVVNAAEFGFPQRRRRIFIIAYLKDTPIYQSIKKTTEENWILNSGILAQALPATNVSQLPIKHFELKGNMVEISENFNKKEIDGVFENSGLMIGGKVSTLKTQANYEGNYTLMKDIVLKNNIDPVFYIKDEDFDKWQYLKGAKKEQRTNNQGFTYNYSEGGMVFPDPLDKPSRTIITGEGGKSASRFKHVIQTANGYRRLTPVELERLNMFPDDHTKIDDVSDSKRAFFMGNALVVGVIEKIGIALANKINKNQQEVKH
ncbi:DNA (cytosine-5-)-methyltransferase [Pedobacter sp. SD-b]|uniref:Cytosine-specific methyltransferase n=1 Tax=Pedobacter segetis TaxID=2793069 RepID=A0ABS1BMW2_9SPHI|nr:DNA (cytosine-5-)-methyltransferase [Pedobacter segetis]MBK0384196.1 DNA (cytosine-5-)-methyltransferase [Pedobacter segetis]